MLQTKAHQRLIAVLIMIALIIWGYWWLTWAVAVLFLCMFSDYYEIIIWGVVYDALYGLPLEQFSGIVYVFSCVSIVLFILSLFFRKLLVAYVPTI